MARRAFDVHPTMRADAFANEKGESDTAVLFVLDEGSDNFVRDLYNNRWRLALRFIPSRPKPVYTPGAPGFAEDTNRPRQPPIVEDHSKYSQPSGATDRKKGKKGKKVDKKGKKHTNVKNAKKGKKNMNVKKHMKGKKAKKQINGKKDKKRRSVIQ